MARLSLGMRRVWIASLPFPSRFSPTELTNYARGCLRRAHRLVHVDPVVRRERTIQTPVIQQVAAQIGAWLSLAGVLLNRRGCRIPSRRQTDIVALRAPCGCGPRRQCGSPEPSLVYGCCGRTRTGPARARVHPHAGLARPGLYARPDSRRSYCWRIPSARARARVSTSWPRCWDVCRRLPGPMCFS